MGAMEQWAAAVTDHLDPTTFPDDGPLRLVVESFPGGGIALFDHEMRFVLAGGRGVDLIGLEPDRLRGKTLSASMPPEIASALEPRFAAALEGRSSTFDLAFGELVLKVRVAPLEDDGAIIGGLVSALDVTASRAESARLRAAEEQYRALAEASPDLVGRYDRDERLAYVNAAIEEAKGVDRGEIIGRRLVELGDPPELTALWRDALHRTIATGEQQVVRYPYPTREGPRWHESRHIPEFSDDGEVTHVTFAARDIHELKTSRDALTARLAQQEAVGDLANAALIATDLDALLTEATRAVSAVLAVPLVEVLERQPDDAAFLLRAGVGWRTGAVGQVRPAGDSQATYALETGAPVRVTDHASEQRFSLDEVLDAHDVRSGVAAPVRTPRGIFGILGAHTRERRGFTDDEVLFLQSVASILGSGIGRLEVEAQLREQAVRDPLTGLANRTLLLERTRTALDRLPRTGGTVALMFVDLDGFKAVNDARGHEAGDVILRDVGARLERIVRPADTVARFGGDEFVVLCEDLDDPHEATVIATRMLDALTVPHRLGDDALVLAASVGAATATGGGATDALLRAADDAMYRAKRRGGSRVKVAETPLG